MRKLSLLLLPIFLGACIHESELKPILPLEFLHDDNSKVWEVDQHSERLDAEHPNFNTLIFYNTGYVFLHPKNNLDVSTGKKGTYALSINPSDTLLTLDFNGDRKSYQITLFSKDEIRFYPKKMDTSSKDASIHIIPFSMPY
ncbi:hypothetical protein SAMN05216474_0718 [Lishizhenia tianjinensis]|uniref:Uncharacterized protein n=1 Tax=Lishizhenia tianjinensis TaxID=477690 RepID=A0A1I6Y873_9FLAO|nr:hypothetical protein [Lishizhenia tianjinensis]SFT46672.1 hypothetical protein SAMN05216474_0718 [Lishizhenia tianjinensis]